MYNDVIPPEFVLAIFLPFFFFTPPAFTAAGVTIENIFKTFLGLERASFTSYHSKRTALTLCLHTGIVAILPILFKRTQLVERLLNASPLIATTCEIMASLGMAFSIAYFYYNIHTQFRETSFMNKLGKYNGNKDEMANDIDDEYREHTTVVVNKTVHTKLMIGSSWLIKLGRYSASFARIGDADFEVVKFIDNSLTTQDGPVVLIIMKATSKDNLFEEFTFSLPSYAHYQLLATRIRGPIRNPVELHMKKSQVDLFVEAFEKELDKNERYKYSGDPPLELCFGCSEKGANVKINCLCERGPTEMYPGTAECTNCLCKPYWCSSCLAKIFMAKQEQAPTDWLFGKAPCPTCRGIFCILDVSRVVLS